MTSEPGRRPAGDRDDDRDRMHELDDDDDGDAAYPVSVYDACEAFRPNNDRNSRNDHE